MHDPRKSSHHVAFFRVFFKISSDWLQRLRFGEFLADNIVRFINLLTYLLTSASDNSIGVSHHCVYCARNVINFVTNQDLNPRRSGLRIM